MSTSFVILKNLRVIDFTVLFVVRELLHMKILGLSRMVKLVGVNNHEMVIEEVRVEIPLIVISKFIYTIVVQPNNIQE